MKIIYNSSINYIFLQNMINDYIPMFIIFNFIYITMYDQYGYKTFFSF